MDRYGASTREYSRNDDFDNHYPRRTAGASDRAYGRVDSTRERAPFHGGRGGTPNPFATSDDDESAYEPRGGHHRQHHRGVASGNGGTRRHRREDPVIEQLRREVREDEARQSGSRFGGEYADDDNDGEDSEFAHRTVMPRGVTRTAGVRAGNNGNGGTHRRRHRREDPVIEQLRREVREDEARLSGSRGHYSDDSEGETEFRRRLEREVRAGRRGNGVRTPPRGHYSDDSEGETEFRRRLEREVRAGRRGNGVRTPPRGPSDDSEDDGMDRGRRGGFCQGRPSEF